MPKGKYPRLNKYSKIQTNKGTFRIKDLILMLERGLARIEIDVAGDWDDMELKEKNGRLIVIGKKIIYREK